MTHIDKVKRSQSQEEPTTLEAEQTAFAAGEGMVSPNFFHLRIMDATVLFGTLSAAQILVPCHNSVSELPRQFLQTHD